jgi:hypothetical protein
MMGWWAYLPIPYLNRVAGHRSPSAVLFLFNLAVVAVAWVALRNRADQQPFWTSQPATDHEQQDEPELPPLPTNEP